MEMQQSPALNHAPVVPAVAATDRIVETSIPSRLDALPWSGFHTRVVLALGITWILDGLEVTLAGALSGALKQSPSLHFSNLDLGIANSAYLAGAVLGALGFGWLTDRIGRKKLFFITLAVYLSATAATALSWDVASYALFRFLTGAGIGGEYTAINSTIQELVPARYRGWTDLVINGSFWIGAAMGAVASIILLDPAVIEPDLGWRMAYLIGAAIGLVVLLMRMWIPESPRWLMIHGHPDEAHAIVDGIERSAIGHDQDLTDGRFTKIRLKMRDHTPISEVVHTLFSAYRQRALAIGREQRMHDLADRRVIAHLQPDLGEAPVRQILIVPDRRALDPVDDGMGLVGMAMDHQPARTLRDPHSHQQHDEADGRANEIGHAPAEIGLDHGGIEQDDGSDGAHRSPDPEAAIDDEIGPAAIARRHQLLDGRVDRGVFAADAGAGEETKQRVARNVPGQSGRGGCRQIDCQRDEEQFLAPDAIGQPAEAERTEHGAREIGGVGNTEIEIGEMQRRALLQRAGQRTSQGHLESVENPGDPEREHDAGMETAPRQRVKTRGNAGLDDTIGRGHRRDYGCMVQRWALLHFHRVV